MAAYATGLARSLGGAILAMETSHAPADCKTLCPHAGEGGLATWQRALAETQPGVVWVQEPAAIRPAMLLDLGERGIPYAIFLHDFTPVCPTHRLWHKHQEICSGPGKIGWKCAYCVTPSWRQWAELPWRTVLFRHRPQDWRTALIRADALIVPSRFARDYWISLGAPPERLLLAPPLAPETVPSPPNPVNGPVSRLVFTGSDSADGVEMLGAALDLVRSSVGVVFTAHFAPDEQRNLREGVAARHRVEFDVNAIVGRGDVAVFPARWEPSSPLEVLRAQWAGARVVATAMGAYPEALIHGVNGYLAGRDDPPALAEAIQEACEPRPASWADPSGENLLHQAGLGRKRLQCLLELMGSGTSEPALEAGHGAWLDKVARRSGDRESDRQRLISALRLLPLAAEPAPDEQIFAQRARALGRT
ncbi:MAG: glycosyltransferase, partial [Terriglobales bacterium]